MGCTNAAREEQKQVVNEKFLKLIPEKGIYVLNGFPFTGVAESHFFNDSLASSSEFEQGKKHGRITKWFSSGIKSFEGTYYEGKQHGQFHSWWRNGNMRSELNFVHGKGQGVQKQWYQSGELFKQLHLMEGREEGLQRAWRKNGKLYCNYEAMNGRIFGLKKAELCYSLKDEEIN